ncbi:MAG: magnesium transporter CorA family protein [Clostridia bacterium]|nr:magnesium transporter CorA family protein [Clostridia bacterium]
MISIYQTDQKTKLTEEIQAERLGGMDLNNKWIHLINPTDQELELVARTTGVAENTLKAALDDEERARIEVEDDETLTVFDIPKIEEETEYFSYSTMPFGFIITKNCIITVCLKDTSLTHAFINNRVKTFTTYQRSRFLYLFLYNTHIKFLQYLRQIDKASSRIQNELHKSTKNKELIQLLDLEKSLVYFSTSLRANCLVIEKLGRTDHIKRYDEDLDLLEDVAIENRQAQEMCNIYRDILSGTMDAYASVISNNLNIVMKLLTSLTVILAIPTLIASLWGMNTGVPFEGKLWGFFAVVVFSLIMTFTGVVLLYRKKML